MPPPGPWLPHCTGRWAGSGEPEAAERPLTLAGGSCHYLLAHGGEAARRGAGNVLPLLEVGPDVGLRNPQTGTFYARYGPTFTNQTAFTWDRG